MTTRKAPKTFFWVITISAFLLGMVRLAAIATNAISDTGELTINEFVAANNVGLTDEDGDYSDWIEIYNGGSQPINLSGWSLTDDPDQPAKWTFPNITLGSREYLVVFASGKDRQPTQPNAPLHTNFRLERAGEFLGLFRVIDGKSGRSTSLNFPKQFDDLSYGRYGGESRYGYMATATPGGPNNETKVWQAEIGAVQFSTGRGFYDAPFSLVLTSTTPGATVRYTTDGSEPGDTTGAVYTEPIPINRTTLVRASAFHPDFLPSSAATHTYIFLDNVLTQPASPPGFPSRWGTHAIDFAGYERGEAVAADYEVDPEVVNDPRYRNNIKNALTALPSISIVTDVHNFHLYANPRERGREWERRASIELMYPDGRSGFQVDAGVRIQGGAGRWEFMPKHSFRLLFKNDYGASKLEYPLFPDSPVERFDTLVLRAGVDRSYAGHPEVGDHRLTTYTRDEWLRATQIALSGVGSHGIFVHLYLNGLYWGLYNVVERPDASFAAAYLGGIKEEWYAVNHRGGISGSSDRFRELMELAAAGNLDDPAKYAAVQARLDVNHFIDYMILNWYAGTSDWPENNWYAGVKNPNGQVKYFIWDGEESWSRGAQIHLGKADLAGVPNTIKILFEALIQNPDFRLTLADRMYKHLYNQGLLTDAAAQSRWREINAPIELAIIGESMRWGDARYEPPITQDDWIQARNKVSAQMAGNAANVIAQARQMGYYPDLDPPDFRPQGGMVPVGIQLSILPDQSASSDSGPNQAILRPDGDVYFTLDGSDPRSPVTGAVAAGAKRYQGPLVLTSTTQVKARTLTNDPAAPARNRWSALNEATFTVQSPAQRGQLRINEIMYNPIGGNAYEFIEIRNWGETEIKLGGAYFEGFRFVFPMDTPPLQPGDTIVLAQDSSAFAERYPGVAIAGIFDGQLSNKGEEITLKSRVGEVLASVRYGDDQAWPISPDGRGDSLVLANPVGDPNDPKNWRASVNLYGSPGDDEPTP